ncbi:MAG TPA: hypothetical protein PLD84_09380 [Chitinophagales bacterium]|nr:hypothetical protein [Chitinophagales bacterium]
MLFKKRTFETVHHLLPVNLFTWCLLLLTVLGYIFIGYWLSRENFLQYLACYLLLFAVYFQLLKRNVRTGQDIPIFKNLEGISAESTGLLLNRKSDLSILIIAGIVFRFLFLLCMPALSDDYFRFAWDGTMWTSGENPYTIIPAVYLQECDKHVNYLIDLYNGMNSPKYYTVYPPISQFIFGISAQLFPENLLGTVIMNRLFCIAAEMGTILLLQKILVHFNLPKRNVLLYALNPLVIIELSGNLHLEAVMIFFLALAIYLLIKSMHHIKTIEEPFSFFSPKQPSVIVLGQPVKPGELEPPVAKRLLLYSALSFGAAIATKLIPLLFLPFLIKRLKWKQSLLYFFITGISFIVLFIPFINQQLLIQWGSSIQLYFQHFEFNASLYYLTRWIGFETVQHDIIRLAGPLMALITFISIIYLAEREKNISWKHFFEAMQWSLTIYLLLATTVHPWYITTLVLCSVITGYKYPIVWSLLIALTYATYQTIPYQENLWLVALEYILVVGVLIYELNSRFHKRQLQFR